jgi:hypothetical protein
MKIVVLFVCLMFSFSTYANWGNGRDSTKSKTPWIRVVKYKADAMLFEVENPGDGLKYNIFAPRWIFGEYSLTTDGFQYSPISEIPDFMTQKQFNKVFWNDDIQPESFFIPYSYIKKVKLWGQKIKIITKDQQKFRFAAQHAKKKFKQIDARLNN